MAMQLYLDFVAHIKRQIEWSRKTFGPANETNNRTKGILEHIGKELGEVAAQPQKLDEWCDLIILAVDGAWRNGFTAEEIAAQLDLKMGKNERRTWPDWRQFSPDQAIEHVRGGTHD